MASSDVAAHPRDTSTAGPRPRADQRAGPWAGRPAWAFRVHLASLAAAAGLLVAVGRNQWFFLDEFLFLGYRREHMTSVLTEYFAPHFGHWSTVPLLWYQLLRDTLGLHSYWPYLLALFVVHLGAAHLAWRFCLRVGAAPWAATGVVAVFAVVGAGWENLVWAFQVGFVGSVLLGFAGLLLVSRDRLTSRARGMVILLLLANLATSGVGLVFLVVTVAVAVIWQGRRALLLAVLPACAYGVWSVGFGGSPAHVGWSGPLWMLPVGYLAFIGTGLTSSAAHMLGSTDYETKVPVLLGAGPLFAFSVATYRLGKHGGQAERAAGAVAAGTVLFYIICGVARVGYGPDQARAARYTYLAVALCLPALALVVDRLARRSGLWRAGLAVLCVAAAVANSSALVKFAALLAQDSQATRRTLYAGIALADSGAPFYRDGQLEPSRAPSVTVSDVRTWRERGLWPAAPELSPVDRASAALGLQVRIVRPSAGQATRSRDSCQRVDNRHPRSYPIHAGAVALVKLGRTQHLAVQLTTSGGVSSRWRVDELSPGTWVVTTLAREGTIQVLAGDDDATALTAC